MLKSVRLNLLLCLTLLASVGTVTAQVQQQPQVETATTDVSDKELNKFATAFQAIQMENQKAQQEMVTIIEENGLKVERFQEIQRAQADPNTELDATEAELEAHKNAIGKLQAMQPKLQSQMEQVIKNKGMSMQRYQEVAAAVQTDQELQQKLQAIMMRMQTGGSEG